MDKKGDAIGENVLMIWRLLLISMIAFVVLGLSSFIFTYDVNVRDVEARILARSVLLCLTEEGYVDLDKYIDDDARYSILDACRFGGDLDEIYVLLSFYDDSNQKVYDLQQGDSGASWVREVAREYEAFEQYEPGFYRENYNVNYKMDDSVVSGKVVVEVAINADV